jgi:cytochrome P450
MSSEPVQDAHDRCPFAGSVSAELHPPRWAPTPLRWQHTRIGWFASWRLALRGLRAGYRHTIFDYATQLPGQDDIVVARAPLAKFVVVRNPDIARYILVDNQDNYAKGAEYDLLAVAFGRGLVTDLDDEQWRRNRRLVQPIFAKHRVDALSPQMTAAAVAAAARWQDHAASGLPLDVAAEMNYITLDIITRAMFGIDLSDELAEQLRVDFARLLTLFGYGFISGGSRSLRRRANRQRSPRLAINTLRRDATRLAPRTMQGLHRIERFIDGLIADYRRGKIDRTDNLLALLMAAEDPETGYRYSDLEIREELMTFLGAGFETTAAALAWTWYLLSENPEVRNRLGHELDEVLAGRNPGADDVEHLPWTQAVLDEAMRRYPPIMILGRVATGDDVLGDYPIKAGTTVAILLHGLHHNQRFWHDAYTFDPARFSGENFNPQLRRAHIPFGAGKRMCVASGFASREATLVIATLAQRFELDLVPGQRLRRELTFTGGPDGKVMMSPRVRTVITDHAATSGTH